jgi:hypothetical protein
MCDYIATYTPVVRRRTLNNTSPWEPVSDCNENYRPVLSSERAPYMKKQELVRLKNI